MGHSVEQWVEKICAGDRRAMAQAISSVERKEVTSVALLKALFHRGGKAYTIGITGLPGAGKSTLLGKVAAEYRRSGKRVGIIAVDPTSPFSGGAILGDRIRMQALATDEGTYIRSMATRGQLGGVAPAARDVATILDAAGCDVVFIETVGVGQDEVEVARIADATAVLVVPGMGDDVQTFKAGVMEVADLFVINKADQPGAERLERELKLLLSVSPQPDAWQPPIVKTTAITGEGIPELCEELEKFRASTEDSAAGLGRLRENVRRRLLELLRQSLFERVALQQIDQQKIDEYVEAILARLRDPHSIVEEMMAVSGVGSGHR
ncbi:MAG: methylmalonyl Co-A mutase-associated GTPase MeaB [Acidobacteria bacterium]|nr:MAG: methylmalonyl Co-A mutase-associated GTPase MeaB [Acidobacteriota bacterium]